MLRNRTMTMNIKSPLVLGLAASLLLAAAPALATSIWRPIASDKGRSIEVDTASIQREKDGKVLATGRLVLDKEIVDARSGGSYKFIQTTTRYDCSQRAGATIRRSFIKASEEVLRDEEMKDAAFMPVRSGTLDDKVLREVCRPPGSRGQAMKVAEQANAAAAALRQSNEAMIRKQLEAIKTVTGKPVSGSTKTVYARGSSPRSKAKPALEVMPEPPRPSTWAYSGPGGPDHWARVQPGYSLCSEGTRQSPIDIRDGIGVDLEPIAFDYRPSHFAISDTGHGIQVRVDGNRLSLLGKNYELERIVFHRPAEERINGRSFDVGVHLEHQAFDGERLVVAVLLELGQPHPLIQTLWNYLPLEPGLEVTPPAATIDLNQLLPERRGYHTYMGSLTTPPCSEGVIWVVLQQALQISPDQDAILARLHPHNARPLQPLQGRLIKSSRPND